MRKRLCTEADTGPEAVLGRKDSVHSAAEKTKAAWREAGGASDKPYRCGSKKGT